MGIGIFSSSSGRNNASELYGIDCRHPSDPNPLNFEINELQQIKNCVIGKVTYPNAINFEGEKILVWKNSTIDDIQKQVKIDPHFLEDNKIIARFRPTNEGYELGIRFCQDILGK